MKKKLALLLAAITTTACLTSCPETTVPRQFGLKPAPLKATVWEGNWAAIDSADETIRFSIKEAGEGVLTVTEPPKDGKPGNTMEVYVRPQSRAKDSHLYFLSYFDKPADQSGDLSLITKSDDHFFYLWHPNHEAVEKAVASGKLKGSVTKTKDGAHSALAADPANYSVLGSPEFWDWSKPQAFFRTDPPTKRK